MGNFKTVSLVEWYNSGTFHQQGAPVQQRLPIVDIRQAGDDDRVLDPGANIVVVHLPLSTLLSGERSCELPPRHVRFVILTEESVLESAKAFFGATMSKATQQSRKPWRVPQVLFSNANLWKEASTLGILKNGKERTLVESRTYCGLCCAIERPFRRR
jgi:hypothetical protein